MERHLGDHYRAMQFVNRLGPEAKTLALWEPRTYYCRGQCQADALLYNWRYLLHLHSSPEAIYRALRAGGLHAPAALRRRAALLLRTT